MSYEPRIIIRKKDLVKALPKLEKEQYHKKDEIATIAQYLLKICESQSIKFDELELVLCQPEGSNFNSNIRNKLTKLKVDYQLDN